MFFIQYSYAAMFSILVSFTISRLILQQAENPVGCAVNPECRSNENECMSFLVPSQTTLQPNFKDDVFLWVDFAVLKYILSVSK